MISIWIVASRLKTCFFSCHSDLDPWLPHIWLVELKLKFAKMPKYEEIPSNLWSDCAFTRKEQTELHTDESEDMSRATLLVPVHKKNFCREMKSISTATGDEHKSSRDNDNAHSEIHHWARFFWCRCRPAHPFTLSSVFKGHRAFCALPGRTACSLIMQLKNEYCALLLFFLPFKDCLLGLGS